jgi:pre-mRNA-processing factor 6
MNSDIKQARQLLQNLIQTNPKHAPGWIAAASLEGKLAPTFFVQS